MQILFYSFLFYDLDNKKQIYLEFYLHLYMTIPENKKKERKEEKQDL